MVVTVVLTSCDSNKKSSDKDDENEDKTTMMKNDAKKMAQFECQIRKIIAQHPDDRTELEDLKSKRSEFRNDIEYKYKDASEADKKYLESAFKTERDKCLDN